jgi:hypothetical protein
MSQSVPKPQTQVVYLLTAILSAFALLAIGFYEGSAWKSFSGKSLWDWLTILLPLVVLLIIIVLVFARPWLRTHQIQLVQHKWRVLWITGIVTLSVIFIIMVFGGYRLNWTWTGFSGNKLWDWLYLLILPVTLSIAPQWFNLYLPQSQSKQQVRPEWRIMWIALLIVFLTTFIIVVVGGYTLGWTWTGFSRKTVWDWIQLLVLPVALVLATILFSKLQNQQYLLRMSTPTSATNQVQQEAGHQQVVVPITPQQLAPSGKSAKPARRNSLITWQGMVMIIVVILFLGGTGFRLSSIFAKPLPPPPVVPHVVIGNGMMLGYNAQHTRVDPDEKIITPANFSFLQEKWMKPTGGTIMSSPTEANGIVYISSNGNTQVIKENGYFYAFNASTGKLKWKKPTGGRIGSSPTLVDGVIYIGSDDGYLYAFRASDGEQLKKISVSPHSPIRSSPAVSTDEKTVYVGSNDGKLYAFNAEANTVNCERQMCKPIWHTYPGGSRRPIQSSPTIANGVLFIGSDDKNDPNNGYLYAFGL